MTQPKTLLYNIMPNKLIILIFERGSWFSSFSVRGTRNSHLKIRVKIRNQFFLRSQANHWNNEVIVFNYENIEAPSITYLIRFTYR